MSYDTTCIAQYPKDGDISRHSGLADRKKQKKAVVSVSAARFSRAHYNAC
jgi:hypothetical protein